MVISKILFNSLIPFNSFLFIRLNFWLWNLIWNPNVRDNQGCFHWSPGLSRPQEPMEPQGSIEPRLKIMVMRPRDVPWLYLMDWEFSNMAYMQISLIMPKKRKRSEDEISILAQVLCFLGVVTSLSLKDIWLHLVALMLQTWINCFWWNKAQPPWDLGFLLLNPPSNCPLPLLFSINCT